MKPSKREFDKYLTEENPLHNTSQNTVSPSISQPIKRGDRIYKNIPYEKLIMIAELLK